MSSSVIRIAPIPCRSASLASFRIARGRGSESRIRLRLPLRRLLRCLPRGRAIEPQRPRCIAVRTRPLLDRELRSLADHVVERTGVAQTQAEVLLEPSDDVPRLRQALLLRHRDKLSRRLPGLGLDVVEVRLKGHGANDTAGRSRRGRGPCRRSFGSAQHRPHESLSARAKRRLPAAEILADAPILRSWLAYLPAR